MLDDRLIKTIFTLPTARLGNIQLYGIFYHYRVLGEAEIGDQVVVVAADRSGLTVRKLGSELDY
ncbi:hypothetical protein [Lacticaseibacillus manihotivorans]|jgi:hypothetical protein|uniref:NfeD-like C-terminal domain-containing protein n=2 Tax=Lacticaseibacillus manihotivorans TaxID=88233 RepID=A0A0R1QM68_9LACO|nr:hypothetical protein [Lacticaseibacillus manihotivorans]KRL42179.1 hypothetical protein FD01_GL001929 [Lacticaseibacillus manihotivorans DSM 13343 = JCM 12514]QFQ91917.1 hypothetical protein LM010_10990 [Lacticaseibacillus manihotivorans]